MAIHSVSIVENLGGLSSKDFDTNDTPWCGRESNIGTLYLQSGQFTNTIKDSETVNAEDFGAQGISWDGVNTPWCGILHNGLYLQSGQFTNVTKTSELIGGIDTAIQDISVDETNTSWCGEQGDSKLYLQSGKFTSVLKTSLNVEAVDLFVAGISFDGDNTPWCDGNLDKLYLTSGQFSSTILTSYDTSGFTYYGISWDGFNTPLLSAKASSKRLYLNSGQYTGTVKTSEVISGIENIPRGIDTNKFNKRIGIPKSDFEIESFTTYQLTISENLGLGQEAFNVGTVAEIGLGIQLENITFDELISLKLLYGLGIQELVYFSELINRISNADRDLNENLGLNETINLEFSTVVNLLITDSIAFDELITLEFSTIVNLLITDSIAFDELITVDYISVFSGIINDNAGLNDNVIIRLTQYSLHEGTRAAEQFFRPYFGVRENRRFPSARLRNGHLPV